MELRLSKRRWLSMLKLWVPLFYVVTSLLLFADIIRRCEATYQEKADIDKTRYRTHPRIGKYLADTYPYSANVGTFTFLSMLLTILLHHGWNVVSYVEGAMTAFGYLGIFLLPQEGYNVDIPHAVSSAICVVAFDSYTDHLIRGLEYALENEMTIEELGPHQTDNVRFVIKLWTWISYFNWTCTTLFGVGFVSEALLRGCDDEFKQILTGIVQHALVAEWGIAVSVIISFVPFAYLHTVEMTPASKTERRAMQRQRTIVKLKKRLSITNSENSKKLSPLELARRERAMKVLDLMQ